MTAPSNALNAPLADAVLLNARRYGLTQENLTQFSELMNSIKGQKTAPAAPTDTASSESAAQEAPQPSYSDLIKDYVMNLALMIYTGLVVTTEKHRTKPGTHASKLIWTSTLWLL